MALSWSWVSQQRLLRLSRGIRHRLGGPKTVYVTARREEYRGYWEAAARALGADFEALTDDVWEIRQAGRATRVSSWVTPCDDPVVLRLAGDKSFTYRLAEAANVPVPRHEVVTTADREPAYRLLERLGRPLVVKPLKGSASGQGVTTHVRDRRSLSRALLLASLYHDQILVEELIAAESCRLLFLGGELLHAVRRRGIRVLGDGTRTIAAALREQGLDRPEADQAVRDTLAAQGLALDVVVPGAVEVVARSLPRKERDFEELRTVYDEDITGLVAPALVAELSEVVRGLGSEFAGVDIMTNDPAKSLAASGGTFLEINTTPGLHHHYVSVTDPARGPAVAVLAYLLEKHPTSVSSRPGGADLPTGQVDV